jgi:hypothetical protein
VVGALVRVNAGGGALEGCITLYMCILINVIYVICMHACMYVCMHA